MATAAARGSHATEPSAAPPRLVLLDGFELRIDGKAIPLPISAQRLLAFLAVHDRPLQRAFVAGSLWLDKSEERASANLRSALWRLRQPGHPLVEASVTHLGLAPAVTVDVRDALCIARSLADGGVPADDEVSQRLLTGDLLPDWYDDWTVIERERLRQLRLHALEALARHLIDQDRLALAIDVALAAVAAEPLRESAHRVLISAHLAEGNRAEALRQYETYRSLMVDQLGVGPSERMTSLLVIAQT